MKTPAVLVSLVLLLCACNPDADGDGHKEDVDCDDANAAIHPGATEICNGIDDNCDDAIDDADAAVDLSTGSTFYADADADGYGDPATSVDACELPAGYAADNTDCDDTTDLANPDAPEICDDLDNDCDDLVDDADDSVDLTTGTTFYADTDEDGYGDPATAVQACEAPTGYILDGADCNDIDDLINPEAVEVCDGFDNDCDELTDDADGDVDLSTGTTWYEDFDEDGYGNELSTTVTCLVPDGYVDDATDCNDADFSVKPGATEVCDEVDNDCNTLIDDEDSGLDLSTASTFWVDGDGDGHGWADSPGSFCVLPSGYAEVDDDCDDSDAGINPDETDIPQDGIDQDCDGDDAPYTVADLVEGDLIISEFMQNPAKVDDSLGEWFEVYNNSGGTLDLDGLYVADDGSDSFTVSGALLVDAGDYVVFGNNSDSKTNGGVTVDYSYGTSMALANGDDEIVLADSSKLGTIYDEIAYDDGATFPDGSGASAQLNDDTWDAGDNDDGSNWCLGTASYGDGDLGTPGADNAVCKAATFNLGHDTALGETSGHAANFWLGSKLVVTSPVTLDKFGLIALSSGQKVKMALYSDASGAPGALIAETSAHTLASARLEMDVTDVRLAAGTYYIMAIYDSTAKISYTTSTSATVWYKSYTFSSSAPAPFGSASTYTGQEFAYYLVVY